MTADSLVIGGKSVGIREMTAEDQPYFQRWLEENADLRLQVDNPHIPTMEDQMQWFESTTARPDRCLFSIVLPDGTLIGNGGFVDIDHERKVATFRITIGNTQHLGKGLGTEATHLLLSYGFDVLGCTRILLKVLRTNERALRMYRRIGFRELHDLSSDDAVRGIIPFEITRDQFLHST